MLKTRILISQRCFCINGEVKGSKLISITFLYLKIIGLYALNVFLTQVRPIASPYMVANPPKLIENKWSMSHRSTKCVDIVVDKAVSIEHYKPTETWPKE